MQQAVGEMGMAETFRGYGDEQGYGFLRQAVCRYYASKGVELAYTEVFIGDGAKSDLGNILDIFAQENTVLIQDPAYPVYVDTNTMAGRQIQYLAGTVQNDFLPLPSPDLEADIVYICSPNNPTGAVYSRGQLQQWVDWALEREAVILFDSAYEAFIQDPAPTSIYEIEGAKRCAIEIRSLQNGWFFRCTLRLHSGTTNWLGGVSLNELGLRRQTTKFNECPTSSSEPPRSSLTTLQQAQENIGITWKTSPYLRCLGGTGPVVHGRQKRPLHLAAVPWRRGILGVFRLPSARVRYCGYPRRRLRAAGGGVLPLYRLWPQGRCAEGHRTFEQIELVRESGWAITAAFCCTNCPDLHIV